MRLFGFLGLVPVVVGASVQHVFTVGPLKCAPPSGYSVLGQQKRDRLAFTRSSPRLDVLISYGSAEARGSDAWQQLNAMYEARRAPKASEADLPEPKQTRWHGLPALLYRLDEVHQGQRRHRMVLTALDAQRQTFLQLEIAFSPGESGAVQKALQAWTKAVKYSPGRGADNL